MIELLNNQNTSLERRQASEKEGNWILSVLVGCIGV